MTTTNKGCLGTILGLFGSQPKAQVRKRDHVNHVATSTAPATSSINPTIETEGLPDSEQFQLIDELPYRVRDDFLSRSELSFYHVLRGVIGDRAVICPEMNLSAIFYVTQPNENQSFRARISQKSIDFLLCEPKTMKPLVGIELDDTTHSRPDRQTRDEFVNKVFEAAKLPLVRIPARRAYTTDEVAVQLEPILGVAQTAAAFLPNLADSAINLPQFPATSQLVPPTCPKCGIAMVVRTVGQGDYKGRKFYGCPNYPRCRQMLPYPEAKPS